MAYDVTLIPGDGIGPEVTEAARRALEATSVVFTWDVQPAGTEAAGATSTPLPAAVLESVRRTGVALKGPTAVPLAVDLRSAGAVEVFEPEQDCVPRFAGMNKVDPLPMMRSGVLLLRHLGERGAADRLERVIAEAVAGGACVTFELKANPHDVNAVGTSQVADAIVAKLKV